MDLCLWYFVPLVAIAIYVVYLRIAGCGGSYARISRSGNNRYLVTTWHVRYCGKHHVILSSVDVCSESYRVYPGINHIHALARGIIRGQSHVI